MRYLILLLFLFGCAPQITHFHGVAMEMPYHIQIGKSLSKKETQRVEQIIRQVFAEVSNIYDHRNPNSELSRLNKSNAPFELSPALEKLFEQTTLVYELSEGRFDPSVGAHIIAHKNRTPLNTPLSSWSDLHIKNHTLITSATTSAFFDFDGIAKGASIDLLLETLLESGFDHLYVEWAGDLRVHGKHPSGRPWQVLVHGKIIPLHNQAIATSGSSIQNWEQDGRRVTHILNPETGAPLEIRDGAISQVSVIAPTCALADGLATAAMLFSSPARAQKIETSYPNIKILLKSDAYTFPQAPENL